QLLSNRGNDPLVRMSEMGLKTGRDKIVNSRTIRQMIFIPRRANYRQRNQVALFGPGYEIVVHSGGQRESGFGYQVKWVFAISSLQDQKSRNRAAQSWRRVRDRLATSGLCLFSNRRPHRRR